MRLSVEQDDPGRTAYSLNRGALVLLDDEEVRDCILADEEEGLVVCYSRNGRGDIIEDGKGGLETHTLRGVVQVILPPRKAP